MKLSASPALLTLPLALLLLVLLAAPAHAGDEVVSYGATDLALEDDDVAEGWEIAYEDVEGTPGEALEGWAAGVAVSSGLEEDALYFETRTLRGPEGVGATLLLAEVEGDPKGFGDALTQRGKALGYVVRPMGHPSRLLVVAAPAAVRTTVVEMQVAHAVHSLAKLGWERLEAGSRLGAESYANGGRKIDPKAGPPLVLLGMIATQEEKWDDAIEALRKAFGPGVSVKPVGRFAMRGYAHLGYALLHKKDETLYRESREAFQKCVALEKYANDEDPKFIQRYNLACAHARLEEVDEALIQLEKSLELARIRMGAEAFPMWVKRHVVSDEDLAGLKDHPGFKAIIEQALAGGGGGHNPGGL